MKVLVLGSGGREHALVKALERDPGVHEVHAAPGNPGMTAPATRHPVDVMDPAEVVALARTLAADLVVIGPEAPLVAGIADAVRAAGMPCFGPDSSAAAIEGSKAFAKEIMAAAAIPTAAARVCETPEEVAAALDEFGAPYVVKDDGLAAGKGVIVTSDRAEAAVHAASCGRVVVEEFLDGPELSVFGLSDGERVLPMVPAQDFKRLRDDDEGPNTGGMGAYAPVDWVPADLVDDVHARVLRPAVAELQARGTPFVGLLYAGLALTSAGVKVVEFNARFGDPETQVLLPLLETPLGALLLAAATGRLDETKPLEWSRESAVVVVMAAAGYPDSPRRGDVISGLTAAESLPAVEVLHAGTADGSPGLSTAGGRVLGVTATGPDLTTARERAYQGVARIDFDGAQFRTDIAGH